MSKESLKLALEALESERDKYLEWGDEDGAPDDVYEAITAIKEALAAPAQEFVCSTGLCHYKPAAQRQWVELTDEEKQEWVELMPDEPKPRHIMNSINVIEVELKEKNT
jgi:hypothetical protein